MPCKDREKYNEYMRVKMNERYAKRRSYAIELLGGKCVDCGTDEKLCFDHIDPLTKSFNVAKYFATRAWKLIEPELEKCQLLCEDCHKIKHACEHGHRSMYRRGCRCEPCRLANNEAQRKYKRKRKERLRTVGS